MKTFEDFLEKHPDLKYINNTTKYNKQIVQNISSNDEKTMLHTNINNNERIVQHTNINNNEGIVQYTNINNNEKILQHTKSNTKQVKNFNEKLHKTNIIKNKTDNQNENIEEFDKAKTKWIFMAISNEIHDDALDNIEDNINLIINYAKRNELMEEREL